MPKDDKYTEKRETTTKTREGQWGQPGKEKSGEYVKETTTKTEGTVKKDE